MPSLTTFANVYYQQEYSWEFYQASLSCPIWHWISAWINVAMGSRFLMSHPPRYQTDSPSWVRFFIPTYYYIVILLYYWRIGYLSIILSRGDSVQHSWYMIYLLVHAPRMVLPKNILKIRSSQKFCSPGGKPILVITSCDRTVRLKPTSSLGLDF